MPGDDLTPEEAKAIRALQRLARSWPRSLTLISMGGGLHVMHTGDPRFDGDKNSSAERGEVVLETIQGIPSDGGDW
jgi:hypothetical protein